VISLGIADDQQLIRMALRVLADTEDDLTMLWEAEDGLAAVRLARQMPPDVILMDIRMPGLDGIEAVRQILSAPETAATRVVMLTTFETDENVFAALRAGAAGFLVKDTDLTDLLRAVRLAAAGESLLSPSVTRRVIESLQTGGAAPARQTHPRLASLTEREREVLALIGEGSNNAEIAERLVVSPATARTHVSRIMIKLGARDRAQLVVVAYQSGLVS
jgi:DNA-binding NarL/FixJ family response regulator